MYHLSIKPIARASGRSATAAAAYRAACVIEDVRTGDVHDYSRKGGVAHSEILLPAGSPSWEADRAALWNAAELAEKRIDSRVAREYEIALPKELSLAQGIALVRDFGHTLIERYGVAVDFNLHQDHRQHWDGSEKGFKAYHAHVLTSTRKLGRDGFGEKATPELSDTKRKSLGLDNGAAEIERVRELWAVVANRHLEEAGHARTLDHRSLTDQGIDREPTLHLGPVATALERGGRGREPEATRLGDANRRIAAAFTQGEQERQALKAISQSIVVLDGDIAQAVAERERQQKRDAQAPVQPQVREQERKQGQGISAPVPAVRASGTASDLLMNDADTARLVGPALVQAMFAHRQAEFEVQLRSLAGQSALSRTQLPLLREEMNALAARTPVAPSGVMAMFKRKDYEASRDAHEAELKAARARIEATERRIRSPEAQREEAQRLADAQIARKWPLSMNAFAEHKAREQRLRQQAAVIVNSFAQHAKRYGVLAETDPQWQAQPVWLQGQIREFVKLSREGGAAEFLERLQQSPEQLKQVQAAIKVGLAKINALPRDKGRGR